VLFLLTPLAFYPGLLFGDLPLLHPWESGYSEWLRSETVEQFLAGQAPLWSSARLAGVPLVEDPRSALGSPQSWLTWAFGAEVARGVCAWLFTGLMGAGTWLWGRSLGWRSGSALVAGILAQANPVLHLGLLDGAAATLALLPWALLALERTRSTGRPWAALGVTALLWGGDPGLGVCCVLVLIGWWLWRGAQARELVALILGGFMSAPLSLPPLLAWLNSDLTPTRPWLVQGGLGPVFSGLPGGLGTSTATLGLLALGLWGLALGAGRGLERFSERRHPLVAAAALMAGVLLCGPLRPLGSADAGAGESTVQVRNLGLDDVPFFPSDLRGTPRFPSPQAGRFMVALDPESQVPGLKVTTINAQNRNVLEFAGVGVVASSLALYGLAPTAPGPPMWLYVLEPNGQGPRAWWTPGGRRAANEREALDFLRTGYAFREAPAIQDLERRLPTDGEITPLVVQDLGGTVRITVPQESRAGVLVLADRWEPEWRVQVDGQDADLLQVGGLFRGVMLPPGAKEVVFEYRLWTWAWGLGLGAVGLLLALGLSFRRAP